ncbi:MAG: hypothetical protein IT371_28205 [Deltaproteobacteria bacterium]|nr:hypothetical protein [Deltaproteobacteria bacterium]
MRCGSIPRRLALTLFVLGALPSAADAKKKAAVLPFGGPGAAGARAGVVAALRAKFDIVGQEAYDTAAGDLGVDGRTAAGMAAVCGKLKCHAVIKGSVGKRRRKFTVVVTVYDGSSGKALGRRAATVRGVSAVARAGSALGKNCAPLVARGSAGKAGVSAPPDQGERQPPPQPPPAQPVARRPPPQPAPAQPPTGSPPVVEADSPPPAQPPVAKASPSGEDTSDIPAYKPKRKKSKRRASADDEGDEDRDDDRDRDKDKDSDEGDDDEGRVKVKKKRRRGKLAGLFDVSVALGLSTRNYELAGANPDQNSRYDGGMFPELTIRGELYPLVPFMDNFARNLGLGLTYARHISISTKLPSGDSDVSTSSQEFLMDLRVRWAFWDSVTSPALTAFVGFGMRDFSLGQNTVLTSFAYKFARFGVAALVPFGTPLIAGELGADARPIFSIGQEAVDAYGVRSGGFAWSVRAGASGRASLGLMTLSYFLTFEYLSFGSSFEGLDPAVSPPRRGYPDRTEPTSGSDRYIRLWVGAGIGI